MAEPPAGARLSIELVWVCDDWADQSPLSQEVADEVAVERDAYSLAGQDARQPRLAAARVTVTDPCTLDEFLARFLNPKAMARLDDGAIGVAVFGRRGRRDQTLRANDRVELLGLVTADPKSDRQARVKARRSVSERDKWRTRPGSV